MPENNNNADKIIWTLYLGTAIALVATGFYTNYQDKKRAAKRRQLFLLRLNVLEWIASKEGMECSTEEFVNRLDEEQKFIDIVMNQKK